MTNDIQPANNDIVMDASGKILGRMASEIASLLRGKDIPNFAPNRYPERKIIVENIVNIKVTGEKAEQKLYKHHTGYPGGLKQLSFRQMFDRNPKKVLTRAVYGMLPKNKLRAHMMRNLEVKE